MRNRYDEAAAAATRDRALRRRLAIFADVLDLDLALARRLAHAIAVDNLLWLLPEEPDHMFVRPHQVLLTWCD